MDLRYLSPPVGHLVIASVEGAGWCPAVWDGTSWIRFVGPEEAGRQTLPAPQVILGWVYVAEFIAHHTTTTAQSGPVRRQDLDALVLRIDGLRGLADNMRTRFLANGAEGETP